MKNGKRILAWAGILLIAAVFIALVFTAFTGGSENTILALLFCAVVIPLIFYAHLLIVKVLQKIRDKNRSDE